MKTIIFCAIIFSTSTIASCPKFDGSYQCIHKETKDKYKVKLQINEEKTESQPLIILTIDEEKINYPIVSKPSYINEEADCKSESIWLTNMTNDYRSTVFFNGKLMIVNSILDSQIKISDGTLDCTKH